MDRLPDACPELVEGSGNLPNMRFFDGLIASIQDTEDVVYDSKASSCVGGNSTP